MNIAMSEQNPEQPIIIKKRKKHGHGGHHGGAWKVAYADFVTAMMAFFLVMWILGLSDATKKGIAQFFREPGVFSFTTGKGVPIDMKFAPLPPRGEGKNSGGTSDLQVAVSDSAKIKIKLEIAQDSMRMEIARDKISETLKKEVEERPGIKKLLTALKIELTEEGLRIEMLDSDSVEFFRLGSAYPTNDATKLVQSLSEELGTMPNFIEVEGHTDSRPYGNGKGYSNWELSNDRANAVRRILEQSGKLWEGQIISVTGYADRKLRIPSNPFDTGNRRVSILVRYRNQRPS